MTAKKKPPPESQEEFTVSPKMLKWAFGAVVSLLGAFILWTQVWDRIDSRWRLETIQKARDDKFDADLKTLEKKAASDLSSHLIADNRSKSWTLFAIQDFRASAETRWAEECVDKKRPPDVCRELDRKAAESRARAAELRSQAMAVSQEPTK